MVTKEGLTCDLQFRRPTAGAGSSPGATTAAEPDEGEEQHTRRLFYSPCSDRRGEDLDEKGCFKDILGATSKANHNSCPFVQKHDHASVPADDLQHSFRPCFEQPEQSVRRNLCWRVCGPC